MSFMAISSGFPIFFRFYAARWFANNPFRLLAFVFSVMLSIAVLIVVLMMCKHLETLEQNRARLLLRPVLTNVSVSKVDLAVSLPGFASAYLVKSFNGIANETQLPLEDVTYSLDRSTTIPYLRYHATLSTKAGYTNIRKFVAVLSSEQPNVALDSIRCSRQDALAQSLDCELVFSAFFAKESVGG